MNAGQVVGETSRVLAPLGAAKDHFLRDPRILPLLGNFLTAKGMQRQLNAVRITIRTLKFPVVRRVGHAIAKRAPLIRAIIVLKPTKRVYEAL